MKSCYNIASVMNAGGKHMIAALILIIGIALVFLAINIKSKITIWLLLVYMLTIFAFSNGGNPDLEIYKWRFTDEIYFKSIVFDFITWSFKSMGLSFIAYKTFIGVFIISVLYKTIQKTTSYIAVVLGLFVIFPFLSTIAQLRNGMMLVVVIYAVVSFIQDQKHSIIPYIIKIIVASLIHPVALFYLVFLLAKVDYRKKKKGIIALVLFGILVIQFIVANNLLYDFAKLFIKNQKYLVYFDYATLMEQTTNEVLNWKGKLLPIVGQIIGYICFRSIYKDFRKKLIDNQGNLELLKSKHGIGYCFNVHQLDMINTMLLLMFLVTPFYMLNPTYFRMFKNVALLIYIVDAQYLYYTFITGRRTKRVIERHLAVVLYAILAQVMTVYSQGHFFEMLESFSRF